VRYSVPGSDLPLWKIIVFCLLIFVAGFAVYANTLTADFIWDDEYLIINNTQIKSFSHITNVFKTYVGYGSENINNFYRPMQELSNMIDFALWGLNPTGFHLTNTVLHAAVGMLVFLLILRLTGDLLASVVGSLFYAVHPVHTEAVAYIAGRADPLYSVFMLISLLLFIKYVNSTGKNPVVYFLSIFFFVVSLLAKEMVFTLPIILFFYMFYFLRHTEKQNLYEKYKWTWLPYGIIVGIYGFLRATVLSFSDIAPASAFNKIPFVLRILTFFRTIVTYFSLLIMPVDLHMERTISITRNVFEPSALFALLLVSAIFWAIYWTYKKNLRLISFSIVWFFVFLLPVSNIVPINSFLAEHWIYMASVGIFLILGSFVSFVWQKIPRGARSLHIAFLCAVIVPLILYARGTVLRNKDWHNEISFFNSTLKYHPKNARLYLNLGNTYYEKKQIDKAIEQYKKAIEINKKYAVAYGNIGSAYLNKRMPKKAEEYLKKAIAYKYNYPIAHYNMGIIYFNRREYNKALEELDIATQQLPQLYQAHNMKGRTYMKIRKPREALAAFEESLRIYPSQPLIQRTVEKLSKLKNE
jgi:tetratricopeptide (TPR) repeat protein